MEIRIHSERECVTVVDTNENLCVECVKQSGQC